MKKKAYPRMLVPEHGLLRGQVLGPECGPLTSALTVGGPLIFHAAKCARASLEPLGQAEAALCASEGLVCRDIHPPPGGKAGHCRAPSPPMMSMCLHARL